MIKSLFVCAALLVAAGAEVPAQYRGLWCEAQDGAYYRCREATGESSRLIRRDGFNVTEEGDCRVKCCHAERQRSPASYALHGHVGRIRTGRCQSAARRSRPPALRQSWCLRLARGGAPSRNSSLRNGFLSVRAVVASFRERPAQLCGTSAFESRFVPLAITANTLASDLSG
jgi:hypothetical protein